MVLLSVAVPFAAFLRPLRELGYGGSTVLAVPGAIAGVMGVFSVLLNRHSLHLFPMAFWPLGVFLIAVIVFIVCAPGNGTTLTIGRQFVGVILYIIIAGVLALGTTQLAAENILYYRLCGTVTGLDLGDRTGHQVRLEQWPEAGRLHSPLDSELRYQFLLNENEKNNTVRLRLVKGEKPIGSIRVIDWSGKQQSLEYNLKVRP